MVGSAGFNAHLQLQIPERPMASIKANLQPTGGEPFVDNCHQQQASARTWLKRSALSLVALACIGAPLRALATSRLEFISSPSSYIGAGESVSISTQDGFSFEAYNYSSPSFVWFWINDFNSNPDWWSSRWWGLKLEAPSQQSLSTGSYQTAARFADLDVSGLDFWGNGRGNNDLRGSFEILDVSYDESGSLLALAANFLQYDNGDLNSWVKGAIRYNSDQPIALTPEPYTPPIILPINPSDEADQAGEPLPGGEPSPLPENLPDNGFIVIDPIVEEGWVDWDGVVLWNDTWYSSGSSFTVITPAPTIANIFSPPSGTPAPGPLPAAAALVGWRWSRRLRRRCQQPFALQGSSRPIDPPR